MYNSHVTYYVSVYVQYFIRQHHFCSFNWCSTFSSRLVPHWFLSQNIQFFMHLIIKMKYEYQVTLKGKGELIFFTTGRIQNYNVELVILPPLYTTSLHMLSYFWHFCEKKKMKELRHWPLCFKFSLLVIIFARLLHV